MTSISNSCDTSSRPRTVYVASTRTQEFLLSTSSTHTRTLRSPDSTGPRGTAATSPVHPAPPCRQPCTGRVREAREVEEGLQGMKVRVVNGTRVIQTALPKTKADRIYSWSAFSDNPAILSRIRTAHALLIDWVIEMIKTTKVIPPWKFHRQYHRVELEDKELWEDCHALVRHWHKGSLANFKKVVLPADPVAEEHSITARVGA
ncbi:hypothetical protein VTI74DRAFT_7132 [Chaetomium olivicolor]